MDDDHYKFQKAMTDWIVSELDKKQINYTKFCRDSNLGKDSRIFRFARTGKRKWTLTDICKIADYFNETPSYILAKVELFYKIHKNNS